VVYIANFADSNIGFGRLDSCALLTLLFATLALTYKTNF